MRRVRYQVACSLDGFIAGPDDDFGWITPEPTFDFEALYAQFDTLLMGRRTYEIVRASGESFRGKQLVVASRSLQATDHPEIEVVSDQLEARIRQLRSEPGRDIWLYGGGDLFSQVLQWDLVDEGQDIADSEMCHQIVDTIVVSLPLEAGVGSTAGGHRSA